MHATNANQGPQAAATFPLYHPPQHIAPGFPHPPQNFSSPPQQYVHPLAPPPPYPQQGGPLRPTQWFAGLCACCADLPICCLTFWCPSITFGQIAEIVDEGSPPRCISSVIYSALLHFTGCPFFYSCCYRTKIRDKYSLSGISMAVINNFLCIGHSKEFIISLCH